MRLDFYAMNESVARSWLVIRSGCLVLGGFGLRKPKVDSVCF